MSKHPVTTVSREKDLLVLKILATGRYRVEDDGTLIDSQWRRGRGPISERKVSGRRCRSGQWLVNLATSGEPRQVTALLSRIVALAKHGDPGMPLGAVHKDGNIDNNHPDNLVWLDGFEWMQQASADGRLHIYQGSAHKNSKLNEPVVKKIKRLIRKGLGATEIRKTLNLNETIGRRAIQFIRDGHTWRHVK